MKTCPRCSSEIGDTAIACLCGWKKENGKTLTPADFRPIVPKPQCQRCSSDATVRIRIGDTWTNLCVPCEVAEKTNQAKEYCASIGVKTPADIRAWLGKNKLLVKRAPVLEREPGCDDE